MVDLEGLKWEKVDTDYHLAANGWKAPVKWIAELIGGNFQSGIPDPNYVKLGVTRTTTQMWVHDTYNQDLDDRFPIGTTRTFDQEMRQLYTVQNDLANGPTYSQWTPYHSGYGDIQDATYSNSGCGR